MFTNWTNVLGSITAILAVLTEVMSKIFGCSAGADSLSPVCTSTMFSPSIMMLITGLFALLTIVAKLLRPGGWLASLFGTTAVIVPESSPKSGVGTVTPAQVAQP